MTATVQVLGSELKLSFYLPEEDWEGRFDQLEVHRARLSESGPYEEITSSGGYAAPRLVTSVIGQLLLVGKDVELQLDEQDSFTCTFTGVDPLTPSQIATQLAAASGGRVQTTTTAGAKVVLVSITGAGLGRTVRVVGGEAAPLLGWGLLPVVFGTDARLPLIHLKTRYVFIDPRGLDFSAGYKTRYRNSTLGTLSAFSGLILPKPTVVPQVEACVAFLDLVDGVGAPAANRRVLISIDSSPGLVQMLATEKTFVSDENGHVELQVARGAKLTVAISGTSLRRRVDVPTDKDRFDLFDPDYSQDDAFAVAVPKRDFYARRSL